MTSLQTLAAMLHYNSRENCDSLNAIMCPERPITLDEACALRLLLFGNINITFGTEWSEQSFHFRRNKPLSYGIVQKRPGPCGVLAAVQAYVLRDLLFMPHHVELEAGLLRPNLSDKKKGLAFALASILWQAGYSSEVFFAVKRDKLALDKNIFKNDGLLEFMYMKHFNCRGCLSLYIYTHVSEIMDDNGSCILFLYSLILTHGIDAIKKEMDFPESHLIGSDGYCSQEIVNLILIGKATPNLFDGNIELNSGGTEVSIHHGVPHVSKIGLLSLLDYQNNCPVGNYYKNPLCPIFLLLCDSHFTVLFATSPDILEKTEADDSFILYHYDGLQRRNIENQLLIKPFDENKPLVTNDNAPAVIKCIYTRWPHASVELKQSNSTNTSDEVEDD